MIKYVKKIYKDYHQEIKYTAPTTASGHLFDVCEDNQDRLLREEQAKALHHSTAQLLILCARSIGH